MKSNYLKIFRDKQEKKPLLKKILTEAFSKITFTKRQKFWWSICLACLIVSFWMKINASESESVSDRVLSSVKNVYEVILSLGADKETSIDIARYWGGAQIVKNMLDYLTSIQIKAIDYINNTPFGTSTMFDHIYYGLTIFAVIGCLYKMLVHFLKTERFDNVMAFTGFFQFIGIALLFVFSDQIVNQVVSLNQGVNTAAIQELNKKLDKELTNQMIKDLKYPIEQIKKEKKILTKAIEKETEEAGSLNPITLIGNKMDVASSKMRINKMILWDAGAALQFKYFFFSSVIGIIASILAIPSVILSIMIKVLLTVMVAGTKIVFLMAFIPGFENTWKTFMTNMLNITLWGPIFNAIYGFITSLIVFMMSEDSLETGQILWLTIICCILAFQSISLTTSAAGVVIQGAGASMAGALGSMSTMSGVGVATGAAKAAVGITAIAVGAKFMSKGKEK
jgi:membrane protein